MKNPLASRIARVMWLMTAASTLAAMLLTGALLVRSHRESIRRTVTNEEVRFRRAMDRALAELEDMLSDLTAEVKDFLNELLAPMFKGGQVKTTSEEATRAIAEIDQMFVNSGAAGILGRLVDSLGKAVKLSDIINAFPPDSDTRDSLALMGQLPGDLAFRLHAEKGLPLEITRDVAREWGYAVDEVGFHAAQRQHETARRHSHSLPSTDPVEQKSA